MGLDILVGLLFVWKFYVSQSWIYIYRQILYLIYGLRLFLDLGIISHLQRLEMKSSYCFFSQA